MDAVLIWNCTKIVHAKISQIAMHVISNIYGHRNHLHTALGNMAYLDNPCYKMSWEHGTMEYAQEVDGIFGSYVSQ